MVYSAVTSVSKVCLTRMIPLLQLTVVTAILLLFYGAHAQQNFATWAAWLAPSLLTLTTGCARGIWETVNKSLTHDRFLTRTPAAMISLYSGKVRASAVARTRPLSCMRPPLHAHTQTCWRVRAPGAR
jgi:hypothetical protein